MKNLNLLNRAEMKKVIGGIMDKETTLDYCLDHIKLDGESQIENDLIEKTAINACYKAYYLMTS